MKKSLISIMVLVTMLNPLNAFADKNNNAKNSNAMNTKAASPSAQSQLKVSNWQLPKSPASVNDVIRVEAGSTIMNKFQFFTIGGSPIEQTKGQVNVIGIVAACPSNVPTPNPSPTKININAAPGKSPAYSPRYLGKSWNVSWKIDKQARGCFKLRATDVPTGLIVESPVFLASSTS